MNDIQPFHRILDEDGSPVTPQRSSWALRLMWLHFGLAGIGFLAGAVGLCAYWYYYLLRFFDLSWSLRINGPDRTYDAGTQIPLMVAITLGVASLVELQAVRCVRHHRQSGLLTARLAAVILLAGVPLGWFLWNMNPENVPAVPANIAQLTLRGVAVAAFVQSAQALWYIVALVVSPRVRYAFTVEDAPTNRALRRVQRVVIGLWLVVTMGVGGALAVQTDVIELPIPHPEPDEFLYATAFDAFTDRYEWDLYLGRDEALILTVGQSSESIREQAFTGNQALLDADQPTVEDQDASSGADKWLVVKYGAPESRNFVWSELDRKFNDMDLRVTLQPLSGPVDNQYGIIFRHRDDENFYLFRLSSDGYYSLVKVKNGVQEEVSVWVQSDAIHQNCPGENDPNCSYDSDYNKLIDQGQVVNELRILARGDEFRFFVNGVPMPLCLKGEYRNSMWSAPGICRTGNVTYVFRDGAFKQGRVALAVGSNNVLSEPVMVAFDDLSIIGPQPDEMDRTYPGDVLYATSFDQRDDAWDLFTGQDSAEIYVVKELAEIDVGGEQPIRMVGGLLVLKYGSPSPNSVIYSTLARELEDMDLRATLRPLSGPVDNQYGVIFRFQDSQNYYAFLISSDGYYSLLKVQDGVPERVSDWGTSTAILPGQDTNVIRIVARGDTFQFYVNDTLMPLCLKGAEAASMWDANEPGVCLTAELTTEYRDGDFPQGLVALAAGSGDDTSTPVAVGVYDLMILRPESGTITPQALEEQP